MTNWEKYYGSPERAAHTSMEYISDCDLVMDNGELFGGVEIYHRDELITTIWYGRIELLSSKLLEWLQEEAS